MRRAAALGLGLWLACLAAPAAARVQVRVDGAVARPGIVDLKDAARLSDAALAAQVQPGAYMLGAAWLQPSQVPAQQRLKAGVLFDLDSLHLRALQRGDMPLAALAAGLRGWIAAMPVTGRVPALLDPRPVEADAAANRPLQDGDRLFYPSRPATIRVVGAVQQPCTLSFVPMQDARLYLRGCARAAHADRDWLYVIEPNGRVYRRGMALWNRAKPLPLAPGALVYLPLSMHETQAIDPAFNHDLAAFLATQPLPGPGAAP